MATVKRDAVERALPTKGFDVEEGDHRYFHHTYRGKRTGVYTKVSRGKKYADLGNDLVHAMKRQLGLQTTRDFRDLVECPMSGADYIAKLKQSGLNLDH